MNTTITQVKSFRDELQRNLGGSPTLKDLLNNNTRMSHEVFVAKVVGTVMASPELQQCSITSIMQSCIKSAQIGLPVDASGYAYLVPRKGECTFQIGSKGYIELVKRNDKVQSITVDAVYDGDVFECWTDDDGKHVKHQYSRLDIDRESSVNFECVFVQVCYKGGGREIEILNKSTINKIKSCAQTSKIWDVWYTEKAKTAAIKRLCKRACLMNVDQALEIDDSNAIELKPQISASINDLIPDYTPSQKIENSPNDLHVESKQV